MESCTRKGTEIAKDVIFRAAASMLGFAMPVAAIQKYLAAGPYGTEIGVANVDENELLQSNSMSEKCMIDFVNQLLLEVYIQRNSPTLQGMFSTGIH
jgi:hypothetical protein